MALKSTKIRFLLLYGTLLGSLVSLMTWARYRFLVIDHALELYVLLIAVIFVIVGVWIGLRWSAPLVIEKTTLVPVHGPSLMHPSVQEELDRLRISSRELEVLTQLSRGLSNEEIADRLFVSTNTVKTHLANLYVKLDVKRRTQAVEKARTLGLIR